jgi:putative tricarboxylic transport membrane protein
MREKTIHRKKTPIRNKAFFTGGCLFLFSLYLFYLIVNFESPSTEYRVISPSFFPYVLTGILSGLSLLLMWEGWRSPPGRILSIDFRNPDTYRTLVLLFILVVFSVLLTTIGFILDAFLFMVAVQFLLGERSFLRILLMALIISFGLYFIFAKLFYVPLPSGFWQL